MLGIKVMYVPTQRGAGARQSMLRNFPMAVLGILALTYIVARALSLTTNTFPASWNLGLRAQIDAFQDWVIGHRASHPVFVYFF